jgi:hypothetical protein
MFHLFGCMTRLALIERLAFLELYKEEEITRQVFQSQKVCAAKQTDILPKTQRGTFAGKNAAVA